MSTHSHLNRTFLLTLVASASLVFTCAAFAIEQTKTPRTWGEHHRQHGGDRGEGAFGLGANGGFGAALKELNLTDEQRKRVADIVSAARPDMQKVRTNMRSLVETFQNTLPDDPKYAAVVAKATTESQELAATLVKQVSAVRTRIYSVLTAEQKARLPEVMKEMSTRHKERRDSKPLSESY